MCSAEGGVWNRRRRRLHERGFAGDGHRLFHGADLQLGVDRRDEVGRELAASRLTLENPGNVNVSVYTPGRRFSIL